MSPLPGKYYSHDPQAKRGNYIDRLEKGSQKSSLGQPEASKRTVNTTTPNLQESQHLTGCGLTGPPLLRDLRSFSRSCFFLKWLSVQITGKQRRTCSSQDSRGKSRKKKYQHLGSNRKISRIAKGKENVFW